MRIVLVGTGVYPIPLMGYGGVERTIIELAAALKEKGQEVRIVDRAGHGRSIDEYRFALELDPSLGFEGSEVLHVHTPVVANRLAGRGARYLYTSHSRHWFSVRDWTDRWGLYLERRAVRRSVATIALTDRLRDRISEQTEGPSRTRLVRIPIGVDARRFRPDWERRDGTHALGVGIVARFKRWDLASRALRGTGVRLSVAGPVVDPAYGDEVRAAGDEVRLLGELSEDQLADAFARSDFLVHPSEVEILPGAVLQALAAGLPVIGAFPIRGVFEDGLHGWTTSERSDTAAVAREIRARALALRSDDAMRRAMGERTRAFAEERYSWSKVADAHLALYREFADGTAAR